MLRSLFSGVSGMRNNQTKMDVIANNISNVNTTAFKAGRVRFQDILSQTVRNATKTADGARGGINPVQVGLGMSVAGIDTIVNQGSLQPTGRPLDVGIDGEGYFVISDGLKTLYSRDGAFNFDADFNIVNSEGYRVMGYSTLPVQMTYTGGGIDWATADVDTTFTNGGDINVNTVTLDETTTDDPDDTTTDTQTVSIAAGDTVQDLIDGLAAEGITATLVPGLGLVMQRTTEPNDGSYITLDGGTDDFASLTANFDASGDENGLRSLKIPSTHPTDPSLRINNFSIETDGTIKGVYEDGSVATLGQLALAKFANPAGLMKMGGNKYMMSANSGMASVGEPSKDGYGDIQQTTLEMSNVDLASEFTDMIITSRAFQANSRSITTSDEMIQELLNLKR